MSGTVFALVEQPKMQDGRANKCKAVDQKFNKKCTMAEQKPNNKCEMVEQKNVRWPRESIFFNARSPYKKM
jgi:hypothetical protein